MPAVASRVVVMVVCLAAVLLAGGCATILDRNGIADARLAQSAVVPGLDGARFWGDEVPANLAAEVRRRAPHLPRLAQNARSVDGRPVVEILALSGGGGDGAFGAGVLSGWTARGNRPEFELVTGISAGAVIAPFAFLGPRYDRQLKEIWTAYRTSELVTASILPGLLGGAALADTSQMELLIAKYVDRALLRAVAREYARGRLLLIGTTNLDAQRPVVWNMGEIARSGHPGAIELFRKVIMASAAIPGAFPPVKITVQAGGKTYDELHVDGGTTREVFASPAPVPFSAFDTLYSAPPIRKIYVIKNGKIAPEPVVVKPQTIPIAARAIATLIKSQNQGELYRIWRTARDSGADFNFLAVPATFKAKANEFVDPKYQTELFDEGFRIGRAGGPWMKAPPELRTGR